MDELSKILEQIGSKTKSSDDKTALERLKRLANDLVVSDATTSNEALAIFKSALARITSDPNQISAVLKEIPMLLGKAAVDLTNRIAEHISDPRVAEQFKENFDLRDTAETLASAVNIATGAAVRTIQEFVKPENIGMTAGGFAKAKSAKLGKQAMDGVDAMIAPMFDLFADFQANSAKIYGDKGGFLFGENVQSLTPGINTDRGKGIDSIRRDYIAAVGQMQGELYIDEATSKEAFKTVYANIRDVSTQLSGFRIKIDDTTTLDSFSSIKLISDQLGISVEDTSEAVNQMTGRWGMSGEAAQKALLNIARGASAANVPTKEMFSNVNLLNSQFSHLGDMTNGVSAAITQFAAALGPTKMGLALDSVKKMVSGIANMSDEMKAFITLGNQLGGGGSAIKGIVRLEEAIASGDQDKLREIQEEFAQKIEELSGGALLTQKEAVESGQEERFYMQAKIAQQMGIAENRMGYSTMVEGLRGPAVGASGLEGLGGSAADLLKRQRQMMTEMSPTAAARGRIGQFEMEGVGQIAEGTISSRRALATGLSEDSSGNIPDLLTKLEMEGRQYAINRESNKEAQVAELRTGALAGINQHQNLLQQGAFSGAGANLGLAGMGATAGMNSGVGFAGSEMAVALENSVQLIDSATSDLGSLTEETATAFKSASEDLKIAAETFNKASEMFVGKEVKVQIQMGPGLNKLIDARVIATRDGSQ